MEEPTSIAVSFSSTRIFSERWMLSCFLPKKQQTKGNYISEEFFFKRFVSPKKPSRCSINFYNSVYFNDVILEFWVLSSWIHLFLGKPQLHCEGCQSTWSDDRQGWCCRCILEDPSDGTSQWLSLVDFGVDFLKLTNLSTLSYGLFRKLHGQFRICLGGFWVTWLEANGHEKTLNDLLLAFVEKVCLRKHLPRGANSWCI